MEWVECLNRTITYMEDRLTEEIDYEALARLACCSSYHYQRMFAYMAGVSLGEYIRRRRMSRAAEDLQAGEKVLDTALRYGYQSPTAFNRALQAVHGVPPSAVREPGAALMGEGLLDPVLQDGAVRRDYVESEGANLADRIQARVNDKRSWAVVRLIQEMCAGEPYGVSRLGEQAGVEKLQAGKLYTAYQKLLSTARLELFYSGSASQGRVEQAMRAAFSPTAMMKSTPSMAARAPTL